MPQILNTFWKGLRQPLLGISTEETTFARRGFKASTPQVQQHLEKVGATFLQGYHAVMVNEQPEVLVPKLNTIEAEWRGFAFEGAGMALALLDTLTPWKRNRVQEFLDATGADHIYMVHVGVGWVPARMKQPMERTLARLDPLLCWLAVDGYGFHEGYFHWPRYVKEQTIPERLSGYALRVFDQGLGRSLWFVDGADVTRIGDTIGAFQPTRQADLWSGVGLGCAYACGVERAAIEALKTAAGSYLPQLAQGAVFAAKARQRASNPTTHTDMACQVLCGISANAAAEITDKTLEKLSANGAEPLYEVWRRKITAHFSTVEMKA